MHNHPTTSRHAFTLAEVVVAVAAVLVLTVAIGQVFQSVSQLVGSGSALSETDQTARVAIAQLTDDAEAFAALEPQDAFIAIRSNRIGDTDQDGTLDANETAVYLSQEDKDFDERNNIPPYAEGSRAVSPRMDELILLGRGISEYATRQQAGLENSGFRRPLAIVSWAHALRPAIDQPPTDPQTGLPRPLDTEDEDTFPTRFFYPDGYDPNDSDRDAWLKAYGAPFSANEFANAFPLARHELILADPAAFTYDNTQTGSLVGARREVAILPRDTENYAALELDPFSLNNLEDEEDVLTRDIALVGFNADGFPTARATVIASGRTDILAMTPRRLRTYLEGQQGSVESNENAIPPDATPFETGPLNRNDITPPTAATVNEPTHSVLPQDFDNGITADAPLWIRTVPERTTTTGQPNTSNDSAALRRANALGLKRAIAGLFARRLVRTEPPLIQRVLSQSPQEPQPEDAFMDNHAVISAGCSNLEFAWSNGFRAPRDFSFNTYLNDPDNPVPQYQAGEIVWFDADYTYDELLAGQTTPALTNFTVPPQYADETLDNPQFYTGALEANTADLRADTSTNIPNTNTPYNDLPFYTDDTAAHTGGGPPDAEYLAAWPYRRPDAAGGLSTPWPKPTHIRARMTLHDKQNRLENGKDYEVIISLEQ